VKSVSSSLGFAMRLSGFILLMLFHLSALAVGGYGSHYNPNENRNYKTDVDKANEALADDNSSATPCPNALIDQILEGDNQTGFLDDGLAALRNCSISSPISSDEMESKLRASGVGMDRSFEGPLSPAQQQAGFINECVEKRKGNLPERSKKAVVGNFYYLKDRLSHGANLNLEAIAGLDRILGAPALHDMKFPSEKTIPGINSIVKNAKKNDATCPANFDQIKSLTSETRSALKEASRLSKIINPGRRTNSPPSKELQDQARTRLHALHATYPWIGKVEFKNLYGEYERSQIRMSGRGAPRDFTPPSIEAVMDDNKLRGALTKHFQGVRQGLVQQTSKITEAAQCLHGTQNNGCLISNMELLTAIPKRNYKDQIDTLIQATNAKTGDPNNESLNNSLQAMLELKYIGECYEGQHRGQKTLKDNMGIAKDVGILAGTVAVTYFTAGGSSAATVPTGTAAASRIAMVGARFLQAARVVVVGADVVGAGSSFAGAFDECTREEMYKLNEGGGGSSQRCGDAGLRMDAEKVTRSCVLKMAMAVGSLTGVSLSVKALAKEAGAALKAEQAIGEAVETAAAPKGKTIETIAEKIDQTKVQVEHVERLQNLNDASAELRGSQAARDIGKTFANPNDQRAFENALEAAHQVGNGKSAFIPIANGDGTVNLVTQLSETEKIKKLKILKSAVDSNGKPLLTSSEIRALTDRGWAGNAAQVENIQDVLAKTEAEAAQLAKNIESFSAKLQSPSLAQSTREELEFLLLHNKDAAVKLEQSLPALRAQNAANAQKLEAAEKLKLAEKAREAKRLALQQDLAKRKNEDVKAIANTKRTLEENERAVTKIQNQKTALTDAQDAFITQARKNDQAAVSDAMNRARAYQQELLDNKNISTEQFKTAEEQLAKIAVTYELSPQGRSASGTYTTEKVIEILSKLSRQ